MKLLKVLCIYLISIILLLLLSRNLYKLYKSFQLDKKYRTSIENYKADNGKYPDNVNKYSGNVGFEYSVYNNNQDYKIFISKDNGLFYEVYLYCSDGAEEKCKEDCKYKLSTRYGKWYHYHQYD